MKQSKSKPKSAPKRVLRLPDLDHTKRIPQNLPRPAERVVQFTF
jgi:hypothetical protein